MTPIAEFIPLISGQIPYVPDPVVIDCLRLTARELCRDTSCWVYEAIDVDSSAEEPIVTFYDMPTDSQIVSVSGVILGGYPIAKIALDQLHRISGGGWTTETGSPKWFYLGAERNQIRLVPIPVATTTLYARLVLEPTMLASALDTVLVDRHLDAFIEGTLARLYRYPDRPWTNYKLSAMYAGSFENSKRVTRSQAADGFQVGVPRSVCYGGI